MSHTPRETSGVRAAVTTVAANADQCTLEPDEQTLAAARRAGDGLLWFHVDAAAQDERDELFAWLGVPPSLAAEAGALPRFDDATGWLYLALPIFVAGADTSPTLRLFVSAHAVITTAPQSLLPVATLLSATGITPQTDSTAGEPLHLIRAETALQSPAQLVAVLANVLVTRFEHATTTTDAEARAAIDLHTACIEALHRLGYPDDPAGTARLTELSHRAARIRDLAMLARITASRRAQPAPAAPSHTPAHHADPSFESSPRDTSARTLLILFSIYAPLSLALLAYAAFTLAAK